MGLRKCILKQCVMHNRTTNTKSNGEAFPGDSSWEPSENLHEDLIRLDYVFKFVLVSYTQFATAAFDFV